MPRWKPPPPLLDDLNCPLYREFLAIPATGTGHDLTDRQLGLLARRTSAERHVRASKIYTNQGLFFYNMRPDRPNLEINDRIDKISDADLASVGMTRDTLPKFASGGERAVITTWVDENGCTAPIDVVWHHILDTCALRDDLEKLPAFELPQVDGQDVEYWSTMSVKIEGVLGFKKFTDHVVEAALEIPEVQHFLKLFQLRKLRLAVSRIEIFSREEQDSENWITFNVRPRCENPSLMEALKIMRGLQVDQYYIAVGLDLRD
ncbi:hypothetical protein BKA65DRAFT_579283 [Rhexocercosporidium sp. MPI-PUGE-AT-0058]|nr:hypothetical protein BKA65DRAFT_579283 [Rhexocercosporidium sp. MPI-PUGE-AT-0058]